MTAEEWRDCVGFEDRISVSSLGRLYSKLSDKLLKTVIHKNGYELISIKPDGKYGKCKTLRVHRMVAEAFIPNFDNLPYVNHKDGNKANNVVSNLEWVTASQNAIHAIEYGLTKPPKNEFCLSPEQHVLIAYHYIPYCKNNGYRALARKLGVSHSVVQRAHQRML